MSKEWVREKLADPKSFRVIAGVVLGGAAVVGVALQSAMNASENDTSTQALVAVSESDQMVPPPSLTTGESTDVLDPAVPNEIVLAEIARLKGALARMPGTTQADWNAMVAEINRLSRLIGAMRSEAEPPANDPSTILADAIVSLRNSLEQLNESTQNSSESSRAMVEFLSDSLKQLRHTAAKFSSADSAPETPLSDEETDLDSSATSESQTQDSLDRSLDVETPQLPSASTLAGLARRKVSQGDLDSAIADIESSIELYPGDKNAWSEIAFDAYLARGNMRLAEQKYNGAESDFSKANLFAATETQEANTLSGRAVARTRQNQMDSGILDFEQAYDRDARVARVRGEDIAIAYRTRGASLYRKADYKSAHADFVAAVHLGAADAETVALLAATHYQLGDHNQAASNFQHAFELSSALLTPWATTAADAFYRRGLKASVDKPEAAIADFTTALRIEPGKVEAVAARGNVYQSDRRWDYAIDDYSQALKARKDPAWLASRSLCFLGKGDVQNALGDFNQAQEAGYLFDAADRSAFAKAFLQRGKDRYKARRFQEVLRDCDQCIQLDNQLVDANLLRGDADLALKDYGQAARDYDRALTLAKQVEGDKPSDLVLRAVYGRGTANLELGRYERAKQDFDETVRSAPRFALAHVKRGIALEQLEMHRKALVSFDEAIRLKDTSYSTLTNRGACLVNVGEYTDAIRDLTRAVQVNPRGADALYNRSIAYRRLGMDTSANADLVKAKQLDPSIED